MSNLLMLLAVVGYYLIGMGLIIHLYERGR